MNGLMMDYPLTLSTIFRRAETLFRRQEIVWRLADKSIRRYTCADFADRARRLAQVLIDLGDRSPATASPPSAGTTARTSRPTSASR